MDNSYLEISRKALLSNVKNLKSLLKSRTKFFAVVKANAYGHGLRQVFEIIDTEVDGYAVHSLEEAKLLKSFGSKRDILIMGYIPLDSVHEAVENGFHFVIYNRETFTQAVNAGREAGLSPKYHLKIETGTTRQGIDIDELNWYVDAIKADDNMRPAGIYTHFANIEDTTRYKYANRQREIFKNAYKLFEDNGIAIPLRHTACSAASMLFDDSHYDLVRVGISLYGYWPSRETYLSFKEKHGVEKAHSFLKPALTWKCSISQVKDVKKGSSIGYGLTYKTTYDSKIAVLPVGYSDGYDRGLSNQGYALVRGERAPVRGRVCMNITMIDVTHIPDVKPEDTAVLIGKDNEECVSADTLAGFTNTINYEIIARLGAHIPRYIVDKE